MWMISNFLLRYLAMNMAFILFFAIVFRFKPEIVFKKNNNKYLHVVGEGYKKKSFNWFVNRYEEFMTVVAWIVAFPMMLTIYSLDKIYFYYYEEVLEGGENN